MNFLLQVLTLGLNEIVPIEQLVARLKEIFTLDPNVQVSIQNLEAEALQADGDTLTMIADWQKAHGFPVTVQPSPAPGPVTDASKK